MLPLELRKLPLKEPTYDISGHFNSAAVALCGYAKTPVHETVVENHRFYLSVWSGSCKRIVHFTGRATECGTLLRASGEENLIAEAECTVAMLPPQLSSNRNPKKYSSGRKAPPVFEPVAQNCYISAIQRSCHSLKVVRWLPQVIDFARFS